jgi:subtilase family serine protease
VEVSFFPSKKPLSSSEASPKKGFKNSTMLHLRALLPVVFVSAILNCLSLGAQATSPSPRIIAQVDETSLTTLKGSVPLLARAQYDQGEASASTLLTHIRLVLSRSSEQQVALSNYLAELQEKSSPNYHEWQTPTQFGKLYGPADSDISAIVAWLESHGLTLETVSPGRTNIAFSGAVSQVEQAFHTSIHSFNANGEQFYSNISDPQIPSALAPVVSGVAHLNTIRPKPQHIRGSAGRIDRETKRLEPLNSSLGRRPKSDLTGGSGTSSDPYVLYIVPGDAATIYDTPNTTFNANYTSGTSYTGSGVTIGIGGDAVIQTSTVVNYRSAFLGNSTAPTITNVDGVTSTEDTDEAYIDTELSGGLAPGATIHFYTSTDLTSAIEEAINDNAVDIFSLSFGECEWGLTTSENSQIVSWWQQAAAQGIAVTVATGDDGSAACDNTQDNNGNNITEAEYGLQVSGFASTPYNIAVGGTDFYELPNSYSTYASTSEGSSSTYYRTAKSYIPESTWNDSTDNDTTISENVPWTAVSGDSSYANIVAGSGGKSSCSTNTSTDTTTGTCTSGYAKPSWQRGTGVPSDGVRDLPDVSFMAGDGFDDAAWLACTDDTGQNGSGTTVTENCSEQSDGNSYFAAFGGTSTSAPAFAGMLALIQQKTGSRLGQAAQELYDLINGSNASSIFHDITVGNNSVPCDSTSSYQGGACVTDSAGYYYLTGYNTNTGYDLATGLGSVDVNQLLTYWDSATGSASATVTVTPAETSLYSSQTLSVTATVTGASGTPTGTVTLSGGGYTSSAETLSGGSYAFTIPANSLSAGTDTLTVTYSGDANYASATGTATVTVTGPTFTLSATNVTVAAGSSGTSTITVAPVAGYTGTVTLTASGPSDEGISLTGSTVTISSVASGTGTVTVSTTAPSSASVRAARSSGSGWYRGAEVTAIAALLFFFVPGHSRRWRKILSAFLFLAAIGLAGIGCGGGGSGSSKTTPTVTVTPAKTSIVVNSSLSVSVSVSGSGSTPTGTVTLSSGSYTSSAASLSSGSATITIPANSLSVGTDTLTVSYSGDSNYNSATGTSRVTVTSASTSAGTYTITVTGTDSSNSKITASATFTLTAN